MDKHKRVIHPIEDSFLTLINLDGFKKYRKVFIHDIKNLARVLGEVDLFKAVQFNQEEKLIYCANLVPNHQIHHTLRNEYPSRLPGVIIPLDDLRAHDLVKIQLLISVEEKFGSTMAIRYQLWSERKWHYIHFTPRSAKKIISFITQLDSY